jgi:PKD repeat protein
MKFLFILTLTVATVLNAFGQSLPTHPVPHVLANGDFLFEGFDDAEQTNYPPFFQGWTGQSVDVVNGTGGYPTNLIATGDTELLGSSAAPNGTSVKNEGASGISIQANRTEGTPQSIALAINTKGASGIDISWTGLSTFSFIDGNTTMQLQYRIGELGEWVNVEGHEYLNTAGSATVGTTKDFGPFRLPAEAEGQDVVEFRWINFLSAPISNNSNRSAVDNISITTEGATGQTPIAAFTISNDEPGAGQIVTFTNQSAGEPDSYLWNFGDGIDSTSTETSPFHTYSEGGEYIVSLIATNGFGSDTAYDTVLVYQNFAPTAEDDVSSTPKNTPDTIQVASNDFDEENNINLSSVAVVSEPSSGAVEPQGDGSLIYMPNTDFVGDDEFTYEICDLDGLCDTAQVTIRVFETGGGNFAPRAKNDVATTDQDLAVNVKVLANDIDVDGQLDVQTLAVTIDATNGTTTVNVSESTITFTPNQGYSGVDSFQYTICDDADETLCDSAWVTVTVNKVATSVNSNANAVKVYPNPASDMINIELTGSGTSTVRIFNVLGKTVYSTQTSLKSFAIDVNDFTSGVYFLQVENNLGLNQKTVVIK